MTPKSCDTPRTLTSCLALTVSRRANGSLGSARMARSTALSTPATTYTPCGSEPPAAAFHSVLSWYFAGRFFQNAACSGVKRVKSVNA